MVVSNTLNGNSEESGKNKRKEYQAFCCHKIWVQPPPPPFLLTCIWGYVSALDTDRSKNKRKGGGKPSLLYQQSWGGGGQIWRHQKKRGLLSVFALWELGIKMVSRNVGHVDKIILTWFPCRKYTPALLLPVVLGSCKPGCKLLTKAVYRNKVPFFKIVWA